MPLIDRDPDMSSPINDSIFSYIVETMLQGGTNPAITNKVSSVMYTHIHAQIYAQVHMILLKVYVENKIMCKS